MAISTARFSCVLATLCLLATSVESDKSKCDPKGSKKRKGHVCLNNGRWMPLIGLGAGFGDCIIGHPEYDRGSCESRENPFSLFKCAELYNETDSIPAHAGEAFFQEVIGDKTKVRLISTSPMWGSEHSIGTAMARLIEAGKIKREDMFIVTNVPDLCSNMSSSVSETFVSDSLAASLKLLKTDYVDALLVGGEFKYLTSNMFQKLMKQIDALVGEGKVRASGFIIPGTTTTHDWPKIGGKFLKSLKHPPSILFTEGNRADAPGSSEEAKVWKENGIVVMGGGVKRGHVATNFIPDPRGDKKENLKRMQYAMRLAAEFGRTGPGPIVPMTYKRRYVEANQKIFKVPNLLKDAMDFVKCTETKEGTLQCGESDDDDDENAAKPSDKEL